MFRKRALWIPVVILLRCPEQKAKGLWLLKGRTRGASDRIHCSLKIARIQQQKHNSAKQNHTKGMEYHLRWPELEDWAEKPHKKILLTFFFLSQPSRTTPTVGAAACSIVIWPCADGAGLVFVGPDQNDVMWSPLVTASSAILTFFGPHDAHWTSLPPHMSTNNSNCWCTAAALDPTESSVTRSAVVRTTGVVELRREDEMHL